MIAVFCAYLILAPTPVVFELLPPGSGGVINGARVRYYLLPEFLKLAEFDAELVKLRKDVQDLTTIEAWLRKDLIEKDAVITSLEADKMVLSDQAIRLETNWQKCEKDLANSSMTPIWPYVVGAVGSALGLVGVGLWVGSL